MACGCDGIDSGSFRNELTIEEVTTVPDNAGGRSRDNWSTFKVIRVSTEFKNVWEAFRRQNINTGQRIVFTGWYDSTIEADQGKMRLDYKGKKYNLTGVKNVDGNDIFMQLTGELERMRTS